MEASEEWHQRVEDKRNIWGAMKAKMLSEGSRAELKMNVEDCEAVFDL